VAFDPWTTLHDFTNNAYLNQLVKRKGGESNKLNLSGSSFARSQQPFNAAAVDDNNDSDLEDLHTG
jgi:hypothetical protein